MPSLNVCVSASAGSAWGRVAEEALAGADDDRVDQQPELVDEVGLEQRLRELRAAVHDDVAARTRSLSLVTSATTSPRSTVVLFHSGLSSVEETTYFGIALNLSANSPSSCGHTGAKPS